MSDALEGGLEVSLEIPFEKANSTLEGAKALAR
jgi:hypothetical protein